MVSQSQSKKSVSAVTLAVRTALNTLTFGIAGGFLCHFIYSGAGVGSAQWNNVLLGYALGFGVGFVNLLMFITALLKCSKLPPIDAAAFISRRFIYRLILTGLLTALVFWKVPVSPIAFIAGLSVTIFTTIGTLIYFSRGEITLLARS